MTSARPVLDLRDCVNDVCPWTGLPVAADALVRYRGHVVGFSDRASRDLFLSALVSFETAIRPAPCTAPRVAA